MDILGRLSGVYGQYTYLLNKSKSWQSIRLSLPTATLIYRFLREIEPKYFVIYALNLDLRFRTEMEINSDSDAWTFRYSSGSLHPNDFSFLSRQILDISEVPICDDIDL